METFDSLILARSTHVTGVVLWIGGVAFVTSVLIPSLRKAIDADSRLPLFEKLERKFAYQARIITLITGISGLYMISVMDVWDRYHQFQY